MSLSKLEMLACMVAIEAPEKWSGYGHTTYVARHLVNEIRDEMTARGIDWRANLKEERRLRAERKSHE